MAEDSVYTKIIKGELPSYKLYEDDKVVVILSIFPIQQGHALVIPKQQVERVWQLDDELYAHVWNVAREMSALLQQKLGAARIGALVDGGEVLHAHVHLIPLNGLHDINAEPWAEPDHSVLSAVHTKLTTDSN